MKTIIVKIGTVDTWDSAYGCVHLTLVNQNDLPKVGQHVRATIKRDRNFWYHFKSKRAWNRFFNQWKKLDKPYKLKFSVITGRFYTVSK